MKRLALVILSTALAATAQQAKTEEPKPSVPWVQKILEVKQADVERVARLISVLGANVRSDPSLRVIAVSGPKETVAAVEEAVKRLDVPSLPLPNVELTVHMLFASPQQGNSTEPAELSGTIKQLRALFPYKGYRVLETFVLRGRDGMGGETKGVIPAPWEGPAATYVFQYRAASLSSSGNSRVIRIDGLRLYLDLPGRTGGRLQSNIHTDIDVREGQKVVVGKSNVSGTEDALVLVVTAKVVE